VKLYTNGTDTYVARDMEHLAALVLKHTGMAHTDEDNLGDDDGWSELPPRTIAIWDEDEDNTLVKTSEEWIATLPEGGFLCSTES
jgi:hypothetical protein